MDLDNNSQTIISWQLSHGMYGVVTSLLQSLLNITSVYRVHWLQVRARFHNWSEGQCGSVDRRLWCLLVWVGALSCDDHSPSWMPGFKVVSYPLWRHFLLVWQRLWTSSWVRLSPQVHLCDAIGMACKCSSSLFASSWTCRLILPFLVPESLCFTITDCDSDTSVKYGICWKVVIYRRDEKGWIKDSLNDQRSNCVLSVRWSGVSLNRKIGGLYLEHRIC